MTQDQVNYITGRIDQMEAALWNYRPTGPTTYREYIDSGYFVVKEKTAEKYGKPFVYTKIFVTAKGELWLEKKTKVSA